MKSEKETDQIGQRLRGITADLKRYMEKRIELMMLSSGEYFSKWVAMSVHRTAGAMFILLGISFLFIALAIYIGNLLGSLSLGYIIVSLPLFILGFSFVYLKPRRLFEELQNRFEIELIEAVEQDGEAKPRQLEVPETENVIK